MQTSKFKLINLYLNNFNFLMVFTYLTKIKFFNCVTGTYPIPYITLREQIFAEFNFADEQFSILTRRF